jgi:CheY-like chemotaxis protein
VTNLTQPVAGPPAQAVKPVLVVDDNATQRYILATWLGRAGFPVLQAATGAEALAVAGSTDLDVVVLDVRLPDISGLEVSRRIKAGGRATPPAILHVSAVAVDVGDRSAGLDQGADAYLTDPIEPQEFVATVRALQRQGQARHEAEHRLRRMRRLTDATTRVTLAVGSGRLAGAAAEGVASVVGGPAVVALLGTGEGAVSGLCRSPGGAAEVYSADQAALRRLLGRLPAQADALGPDWHCVLPAGASAGLADTGDGGLTVWPVYRRGGEPVGLCAAPRHAGGETDDPTLLRQLVESVAITHENLRQFAEEHRIALTLQRSLLPAALPTLAGLRLAARYQAAEEQAEVGGDFYDAMQTPDGRALVVIGDVQGHSLHAAVLMGELRYALRAYAEDCHPPQELIRRLNRLLLRHHPNTIATMCIVALSPDRATATIANAGHIPPLLAYRGKAGYLGYGGPVLGVAAPPAAPLVEPFPPGTRLLLVTDGLVERRDRSMDAEMADLAAAFGADGGKIDATADALMDRPRLAGDDAALVVLERVE